MKLFLLNISLILTVYSFANGPWTQKANIPAEGRHRTTGWSIGNKGYIGLGHYNSGPLGNVAKADIWEYDPTADSWTQKADYGGGATYGASAFSIGQKAYVGGHVYNSAEFFEFDPIANTWNIISPLPSGQSDMTAFSINDKGYYVTSSSIYEYDPILDSWTLVAFNPGSFFSWSKSFTIGEKAYIVGSSSGSLYEFKQSTYEFVLRSPYPGDGIGGWAAFSAGGKGYVCTGYINFLSPTSRQLWEYDPQTDHWEQYEDLPGATRRFSSSFSIGNKGYVGTGTNGINFNDLWEFDPANAVSIEEPELVDIICYPNPSTEIINIQVDLNKVASYDIEIFDMSGNLIYSKVNIAQSVLELNKETFKSGTYLYRIKTSGSLNYNQGKFTFI